MEKLSDRMNGLLKGPKRHSDASANACESALAAANEKKKALQEEQIMEELRAALVKENIYTGAGIREFTIKFVSKRRKELEQENDQIAADTIGISDNQNSPEIASSSLAREEQNSDDKPGISFIGRIGNALHLPGSSSAPATQDKDDANMNILASTGALSGKEHDSSVFFYQHNMESAEIGLSGDSSQDIDFDQSTSSLICGFGTQQQGSSRAINSSLVLKNLIEEDIPEEEGDGDSIASLGSDKDRPGEQKQASMNLSDMHL
mmetsp:Transcript_2666/g.3883  ORF Transcript_2666/g.3883 Transcript_2666/m.3883 type:complete len:263 (+) Transcript_2666:286-1074(+)